MVLIDVVADLSFDDLELLHAHDGAFYAVEVGEPHQRVHESPLDGQLLLYFELLYLDLRG